MTEYSTIHKAVPIKVTVCNDCFKVPEVISHQGGTSYSIKCPQCGKIVLGVTPQGVMVKWNAENCYTILVKEI